MDKLHASKVLTNCMQKISPPGGHPLNTENAAKTAKMPNLVELDKNTKYELLEDKPQERRTRGGPTQHRRLGPRAAMEPAREPGVGTPARKQRKRREEHNEEQKAEKEQHQPEPETVAHRREKLPTGNQDKRLNNTRNRGTTRSDSAGGDETHAGTRRKPPTRRTRKTEGAQRQARPRTTPPATRRNKQHNPSSIPQALETTAQLWCEQSLPRLPEDHACLSLVQARPRPAPYECGLGYNASFLSVASEQVL